MMKWLAQCIFSFFAAFAAGAASAQCSQIVADEPAVMVEGRVAASLRIPCTPCAAQSTLWVCSVDSQGVALARNAWLIPASGKVSIQIPAPSSTPHGLLCYVSDGAGSVQTSAYFPLGSTTPVCGNADDAAAPRALKLYPEGCRALLNHYTRFIAEGPGLDSLPHGSQLVVRNPGNNIVAVARLNAHKRAVLDLPLFSGEWYTLSTKAGVVMGTLRTDSLGLVSDTGFAMRAEAGNKVVEVEMRKGDKESRRFSKLAVRLGSTVIYETEAHFRKDTNVVVTHFTTHGLEGRLLYLAMEDEAGVVVAERLLGIPPLDEKAFSSCSVSLPFGLDAETVLPEYLLVARPPDIQREASSRGLRFHFRAPAMAGRVLQYQLAKSDGALMEVGEAAVDSSGTLVVSDLHFSGKAQLRFFGAPPQEIGSMIRVPESLPEACRGLLQCVFSVGAAGNAVHGKVSATPDTLPDVMVVGKLMARKEALEQKYIGSNMFRDELALGMDLEEDPYTSNYDLYDYLLRKLPGLQVRPDPANPLRKNFVYRQGWVEVYLDEVYIGQAADLPFRNLQDIGYIRFLKKPVSPMRNAAGGSLLQNRSNLAGITATLVLYTRKVVDRGAGAGAASNGFLVEGYANE
jgi:hypothetical protein